MLLPEKIRCFLLPMLLIPLLALRVSADECPHQWVQRRLEPTCDQKGMVWNGCILCGDTRDYDTIDPLGHSFCDWYILTVPTCTQDGSQARDCSVCSFRETVEIPKTGHTTAVQIIDPTCTARGIIRYYCPACDHRFRTDYTDPLGHDYVGEIILDPTLTTMGRILYTCTRCKDTYQEYTPKLTNPFVDLDKNAYYFTSVLWAVYYGIASGMDETHFVPDGICTRAQVVTFLWRSAGKPEPKTTVNPFKDVKKGCYYEKAVLWAYETAITQGTDADRFSPDDPCTRAQVVTFLHRFRGCPDPGITSAFPDVPASAYYCKAVLWAARRNITVGMDGGYFCPNLSCTRGQIVTFLYRDAKNP